MKARKRDTRRAIKTQHRNEVKVTVTPVSDSHSSVTLFVRDEGHAGRKITLKYTYTSLFTAFVHIQLR